MILSPVVGIIHNTKLGRWHPVYFREAPLPGPDSPGKPARHESAAHSTEGFGDRESAVLAARNLAEELRSHAVGPVSLAIDSDFQWDGEGVPLIVCFFAVDGESATPLF